MRASTPDPERFSITDPEEAVHRELAAVEAALKAVKGRVPDSGPRWPRGAETPEPQRSGSVTRQPSPYVDRYTSPTSWHRRSAERPSPARRQNRSPPLREPPPCARLAAAMPAWKMLHISPTGHEVGADRRLPHVIGPCFKLPSPSVIRAHREPSPPRAIAHVPVLRSQPTASHATKTIPAERKAKPQSTRSTHLEADLNRLLVQTHRLNRTLEGATRQDQRGPTPYIPTSHPAPQLGEDPQLGAAYLRRDEYFKHLAQQSHQLKETIDHQVKLFEAIEADTKPPPLRTTLPSTSPVTASAPFAALRADQHALQARLAAMLTKPAGAPAGPVRLRCSVLADGSVLPVEAGVPTDSYSLPPDVQGTDSTSIEAYAAPSVPPSAAPLRRISSSDSSLHAEPAVQPAMPRVGPTSIEADAAPSAPPSAAPLRRISSSASSHHADSPEPAPIPSNPPTESAVLQSYRIPSPTPAGPSFRPPSTSGSEASSSHRRMSPSMLPAPMAASFDQDPVDEDSPVSDESSDGGWR